MPRVTAAFGQRHVHVEHDNALRALAMRVRDAVHAGVAASDHDHPLAVSGDLPARLGIAHYELLPQLLARELRAALPATEIVSATSLMDDIRLVKSDWEIARMRQAAAAVEAGWQAFVDVLRPGLPEYAIVAAVEAAIKERGAEDNFMLIASGGDEVRGMTAPSPRVLDAGDMVRTELTPQVNGYWLQICRSATVGRASDAQRRSFDLFNEAVDDWDEHFEKLADFWSSVMLTSGRYKGNPMRAHLKHKRITPEFFTRWLRLWHETTREVFGPEVAAQFGFKAERIAESLQLALFYRPDAIPIRRAAAP